MTARPTRSELAVTLFCGVWAAAALAPEGWAVLLAPAWAFAAFSARRRPGLAGAAFVVLSLLGSLVGVPSDNPAALPVGFAVLFSAGRYARRSIGLAVLGSVTAVAGVVDEFSLGNLLFAAFIFGSVYGFGLLVRRRTFAARSARAQLGDLVAQDAGSVAAAVVAEERTRLAGEAVSVVSQAVGHMRREASRAGVDLDPAALESVQASGREAVAELRRLLGLLRAEEEAVPEARPRSRWRWRGPVITAVSLTGACLLENASSLDDVAPLSIGLSLAVLMGAAVRTVDLVLGCLLTSAALFVAVVADTPLVYGAWDTAACALLLWSVAADGRTRSYAVGSLVVLLGVVDVHLHAPGNEAFVLAVFGMSGVAGHLWAEREREERAALERVAGLRSERAAIAAEAVREERLRLARELHDVVSHAIGVMVLQAGAAAALRERDPEAARAAVRAVLDAGIGATTELELLFGLVDAGAVGTAGVAGPEGTDVAGLVERMRHSGLTISLSCAGVPADPTVQTAVFRVVQEALTNAARHAPGAPIAVRVGDVGGWLLVEVSNQPTAQPRGVATRGTESEGAGFGLVGLAERVRALGGDLAAGPSLEGGFVVSVRLPLAREAAQT